MKSVLQDKKECYACGTTYNLHDHHIIFGTANRRNSEKYGLKVFLCQEHHTGSAGVHFNRDFDLRLKKMAQTHFEAEFGARNEFVSIFGKSYL